MKRIKYLILLVLLMPVFVSAENLSLLPSTVTSNEDVVFNNFSDKYIGYVPNDTNTISFSQNAFDGVYLDGNVDILLNEETTIYNIKGYLTSEKKDIFVIPVEIRKLRGEQSTELKNIEVVGYNLDFKNTIKEYTISVPSEVNEVYIKTENNGNATYVNGSGIVELTDNKTVVELEVINTIVQSSNTYKITIVKKNKTVTAIIWVSIFFIIVIGCIIFFFERYHKKISNINPDILKRKIKEINPEEIIKQNEEKNNQNNLNDISSSNLTPGVLTPRTMILEDNNK